MKSVLIFVFVLLAGSGVTMAASDAVMVGNPQEPQALQEAILTAYRAGSRSIIVSPGIYVIPGALGFSGLEDAEISAYQVELAVDGGESGAVVFEKCRNVTFRGATLRYTKPRTGQARILNTGSDEEGAFCDIQLEPGFPMDASFKISGLIDGRTLLPKADAGSARLLKQLGSPGHVRLYWNGTPGWEKLQDKNFHAVPGDYLVCRGPGGMMCYAKGSKDCTFEDITIYWGGVFGFYETHGCSGNRYVRNIITYGPPPPEATMRALASQSADGLHSGGSLIGPQMENCFFEGQMDDGVNIHGHFYQVAESEGNSLTIGFPSNFLEGPREYEPGDRIGIYDVRTKRVFERKVVAVESSPFATSRASRHEYFRNCFPARPLHYVKLVLDENADAPFDSVAWFPARCGAGYKITGCTIRNSWCRGFLLKADDGSVSNSLVEGCLAAGIVVSTEMNWAESGYSRNVTITGNTLRNCARYVIDALGAQAGALVVTTVGMQGMGHQNIRIVGNTFEDINLTNLVIRWVRGAEVKGNRFVDPLQASSLTGDIGERFGIAPRALVWIGDSEDVSLSDNSVINPGPQAETLLSVSPTATNIRGTLELEAPEASAP